MKRLIPTLSLIPGAAFAHGGHAPVPEAAHGALHVGPLAAIALIAAAAILAFLRRDRS